MDDCGASNANDSDPRPVSSPHPDARLVNRQATEPGQAMEHHPNPKVTAPLIAGATEEPLDFFLPGELFFRNCMAAFTTSDELRDHVQLPHLPTSRYQVIATATPWYL